VKSVLHRGPGHRPEAALTYDDGPGESTRAILDLLASHDARATFFMVGGEVERDPELAREVVAAGHEVGSHSMHHLDHDHETPADAVADMVAGAAAIAGVLGLEPRLYRAPYGYFVQETAAEADRRGWSCIAWSAEGRDWEEDATAESVADRIRPLLVPGAIVLLHDSRREKSMNPEPVIGATALLLEELDRRGLRSRAVSDIMR
jgi:peptidoglycan/xylan/chitin deacetylase (PgdA/CDA1 family)